MTCLDVLSECLSPSYMFGCLALHFNITLNQCVRSSVPVVSRWLIPGNRTFLEVASMGVTWWIVAFLHSVRG